MNMKKTLLLILISTTIGGAPNQATTTTSAPDTPKDTYFQRGAAALTDQMVEFKKATANREATTQAGPLRHFIEKSLFPIEKDKGKAPSLDDDIHYDSEVAEFLKNAQSTETTDEDDIKTLRKELGNITTKDNILVSVPELEKRYEDPSFALEKATIFLSIQKQKKWVDQAKKEVDQAKKKEILIFTEQDFVDIEKRLNKFENRAKKKLRKSGLKEPNMSVCDDKEDIVIYNPNRIELISDDSEEISKESSEEPIEQTQVYGNRKREEVCDGAIDETDTLINEPDAKRTRLE